VPESTILIQYVVNERAAKPTGFRVWSDGRAQRCAESNSQPGPTERLDLDRDLTWTDSGQFDSAQLDAIRRAIRSSGIFDLPPRLLINYCKEDPGTGIWTVNLDGQTARIVVYDPRPKRNTELDGLLQAISAIKVSG